MNRLIVAVLTASFAFSAPALAAGSGSGNTSGVHNCKSGEVWDKKKQKCVQADSGILPDEDLYQQGLAIAKAGYYDWALQVFAAIQNQDDPRVLNYIGYSHRKAGRLDLGITYYRKALAINPNFVLAREYLGEGYVSAGKIELAKAELSEIAARCGTGCEEYKDLSEAIAAAN